MRVPFPPAEAIVLKSYLRLGTILPDYRMRKTMENMTVFSKEMELVSGFVVFISGLPGSGKKTFSLELKTYLQQHSFPVELFSDEIAEDLLSLKGKDIKERIEKISRLCNILNRNKIISVIILAENWEEMIPELKKRLKMSFHIHIQRIFQSLSNSKSTIVFTQSEVDTYFQTGAEPLSLGVQRIYGELVKRNLIPETGSRFEDIEQILIKRLENLGYL
jgi:hypothetical protein